MPSATMADMDDDLIQRRRERLTPDGQGLLDDTLEEMRSGAAPRVGMEEFVSRMAELPSGDRGELIGILGALGHGFGRAAQEASEKARMAREGVRAIEMAQEKQRAAGLPVNEEVTVGEALELLREEERVRDPNASGGREERTYSAPWRARGIADGAVTIDEMIGALLAAAEELRAMRDDGVRLADGVEDDYGRLETDNLWVAEKYGLQEDEEEEDAP